MTASWSSIPGIQFTTFLGGGANEIGAGIGVDGAGNSYIGGTTQSPDFPTTPGAFRRTGSAQNNRGRVRDEAESRRDGARLLDVRRRQQPRLRKRHRDRRRGQRLRHRHDEVVELPDPGNAFDRTVNIPPNCPRCGTDHTDGFVFKLNATGSALIYSTYLGGTDLDVAARHRGGRRRATPTSSARRWRSDFPTTAGAFRRTNAGEYDMFVTKLNATGSAPSPTRPSWAARRSTTASESPSTPAATPTCSASRARPTSRRRPGRSTRRPTARFDATVTKLNPDRLGARLLHAISAGRASTTAATSRSTAAATRTSAAAAARRTSRRRRAPSTRRPTAATRSSRS